jgi:glycosyltransferase involved in cell wall biosynthesis
MKVLHIINNLQIGGAEVLLKDLAPIFKQLGVDLTVVLLCSTNSPLESEIEKAGIKIIQGTYGIYCPKNIFFLGSILEHYDIVHAHLFPTQLWVALGKRLYQSSTPLITTEHSTNNRRRKLWLRPIDKWMYDQFIEIISISEAVKQSLVGWLPDLDNKIETIPNGINLERFKTAQKADKNEVISNPNERVILTVGRLEPQKDYYTLLQAVSMIENVRLVLAGDGSMREELERLAENLKVRERVVFLGCRLDIPELIKMADIYVQSSRWEGFGIAALEAMAGGLPVVASNVPGLAQVVGQAGKLFPLGDSVALASILQSLLTDPRMREQLSRAGLERAEQFSIEKTAKETLKIYKRVIDNTEIRQKTAKNIVTDRP